MEISINSDNSKMLERVKKYEKVAVHLVSNAKDGKRIHHLGSIRQKLRSFTVSQNDKTQSMAMEAITQIDEILGNL